MTKCDIQEQKKTNYNNNNNIQQLAPNQNCSSGQGLEAFLSKSQSLSQNEKKTDFIPNIFWQEQGLAVTQVGEEWTHCLHQV